MSLDINQLKQLALQLAPLLQGGSAEGLMPATPIQEEYQMRYPVRKRRRTSAKPKSTKTSKSRKRSTTRKRKTPAVMHWY